MGHQFRIGNNCFSRNSLKKKRDLSLQVKSGKLIATKKNIPGQKSEAPLPSLKLDASKATHKLTETSILKLRFKTENFPKIAPPFIYLSMPCI